MSNPGLEALEPVHNSHLTAYRRCKQKFKYAFIDGIQPRLPGLPLARGIWLHYCLEAQYLRWGIDADTLLITPESTNVDGVGSVSIDKDNRQLVVYVDENNWTTYDLSAAGMLKLLIEQVWNKLMEPEKEKYTEADHTLPEACSRILTEYFYYWKDKPKPVVLLVEVEWMRSYGEVTFEGRTDYVVRRPELNNLLVCGDWKSTKSEPGPEYKFMESQLHLYPWGIAPMLQKLGLTEDEVKTMAVEFDYLSTVLPTKPSQNADGSMSKRKINTTYLTLVNALKEYGMKWTADEIAEYLQRTERAYFKRETLPRKMLTIRTLLDENRNDSLLAGVLVENPDMSTRTVTKTCQWDCDFMPICKGELYGQNIDYILKTQYEPRSNSHAGVAEKPDD